MLSLFQVSTTSSSSRSYSFPCTFGMVPGSKQAQMMSRSEYVPVVLTTLCIYRAYIKANEGQKGRHVCTGMS